MLLIFYIVINILIYYFKTILISAKYILFVLRQVGVEHFLDFLNHYFLSLMFHFHFLISIDIQKFLLYFWNFSRFHFIAIY